MTTKQTNESAYVEALAHGTIEKWVRDSFLNAESRLVVFFKGKRWAIGSGSRITSRCLLDSGFINRTV